VVPAGTKAYGELSQATPQGWVSLQFHTLELPGGEREKINGSAVSMERTALRGDVTPERFKGDEEQLSSSPLTCAHI